MPPAANVVISNVPGSRELRYLNGAVLVEQYPMSMLIDGQALNITVTSHDDRLDFGLLACPNALPDPQRLAVGLEKALGQLETAFRAVGKDGSNRMAKKERVESGPAKERAAGKKKVSKKKILTKKVLTKKVASSKPGLTRT